MDAGRRSRQAATSPPTARLTPDPPRRSDDASSRGRRAASWRCANPTQPSPRHAFDQRIRLRSPARPPGKSATQHPAPGPTSCPADEAPSPHPALDPASRDASSSDGGKGAPAEEAAACLSSNGEQASCCPPPLPVRCARYLPFGFAAAAAAAAAAACLARLGLRYAKYAATPATTTTTTMPATTAPVVAPSSGADWLPSVVS